MNSHTDYYKILGVSENASDDEIKRAYRRLAKKYHPDSQGGDRAAEEKFKQISEAYNTLKDKQKRSQYDMLRRGGFTGTGGSGDTQFHFGEGFFGNMQDLFGSLFGDINGRNASGAHGFSGQGDMGDVFGRRKSTSQSHRGRDVESTLTLPFDLAVRGGETIVSTTGGKKIKIKVAPGTEDGKKIRIRGQGEPGPRGGPAGDLYLIIRVTPHPEFERKGKDIYSTLTINIAEAVLGTEVFVKTISGKKVKLKIPAGTNGGTVFRIPRMGISNDSGIGDHYVRVQIDAVKNLSLAQRKEFKNWAISVGLLKK